MDLFDNIPEGAEVDADSWLETLDIAEEAGIDTDNYVTLQFSGGRKHMQTTGEENILQLMTMSNVMHSGQVDFYVDGATVPGDYVPQAGATVTAIGNVKAG